MSTTSNKPANAHLIERLRAADIASVQREMGCRIFGEAADEIERLNALLAVAVDYASAEKPDVTPLHALKAKKQGAAS